MLLLALNAIFAGLFFNFARNTFKRAIPFLRTGWATISVETKKPDYRQNVESRQAISEGGRFLIGGMVWMGITLGLIGLAVFFAVEALRLYVG